MRLPPNSHAIRVYSGKDSWIYQVVGTVLGEHALVVYALEDGTEPWRTTDVPMRWLRGSSRALAEALREDAINWERRLSSAWPRERNVEVRRERGE